MNFEVHVAANFTHFGTLSKQSNQNFVKWLKKNNVILHNVPIERGIGNLRSNLLTLKCLELIMKENHFRFVHVHTPIASVLGRLVANKEHIPVIYTAHGFHFSKSSSKRNWLAFPIEWFFSFTTSRLLLINQEDFLLAKKKMHAKETYYVPGVGINFELVKYNNIKDHVLEKKKLLDKYHLPKNSKIIISVGELSNRKNHQIIIKALAKLDQKSIHFFIAGRGKNKNSLELLANELGINNQVHFLNYTENVRKLNLAADLSILPSLREGLSRAGLEAIRDGVYLLGANVRGIKDYIFNDEIGEVFDPHDINALAILIKKNIDRPRVELTDLTISRLMRFDRSVVDKQMKDIYEKM